MSGPRDKNYVALFDSADQRAMADQRRWVRVPINVRVRLWYERERKQQQCHCRSFDISEGGIGLMSP